jgi:hypothetical protein
MKYVIQDNATKRYISGSYYPNTIYIRLPIFTEHRMSAGRYTSVRAAEDYIENEGWYLSNYRVREL